MDLLLMFFTNPIAPVVVLVVVIIIYILVIRNRFVRLDNKVKQSKSGIDVFLTKRFELIPNLVETVKGYMLHEEKVLESLTEKRSVYLQNKDLGVGKDSSETKGLSLSPYTDIFSVSPRRWQRRLTIISMLRNGFWLIYNLNPINSR